MATTQIDLTGLVKIVSSDQVFYLDKTKTVTDMYHEEPKFYTAKFGSRETFDSYNGGLIASYTVTHGFGTRGHKSTERKRATYLFLLDPETGRWHYSYIGNYKTMKACKKRIDTAIEDGVGGLQC